jgi:predicted dehydrogenase
MRQVVQDLRSGGLRVEDVPAPTVLGTSLLVANEYSLISAGTERATVDLARKSLIAKARARPDLVRKVVESTHRDGIRETLRMVNARLDRQAQLGYSCAGIVIAAGNRVRGFAVGDRVACAGQDHASHAEIVCVPTHLCVKVPEGVTTADAAYVALGAIALQGVRQAAPALGEIVAVIGLGLVGQLVAQLLVANGCRVVASDLDIDRLALANSLGTQRAVLPDGLESACVEETGGRGVDAVIVTASTASNAPVEAAAAICRQRGRVVIVGAVGMDLPREPFYRKELELRLSTSYGPGRYDPAYEEGGIDYPYGFVRWTEGRNLAAFLDLVASGRVNVARLTSHRFDISDAQAAYDLLQGDAPSLGILLAYPQPASANAVQTRIPLQAPSRRPDGAVRIGLIGPGNHVQDRLLPSLRANEGVAIQAVCAGSGVNSRRIAESLHSAYCTTDYHEVLADPNVDAVLIGTRHASHARIVCDALAAGKHVFVEKPLCLTEAELADIEAAYSHAAVDRPRTLQVGFNRRHSAHVDEIRRFFADRREPLMLSYRVNAGALPATHWIHAEGGRLLGEMCHFIDTIIALTAAPKRVSSVATPAADQTVITLELADGSVASILYTAAGDTGVSKERLEVFGAGRTAVLDDFATTTFHAKGRERRFRTRPRDKGFQQEMARFVAAVREDICGDGAFADARLATLATLRAATSLATREPQDVE